MKQSEPGKGEPLLAAPVIHTYVRTDTVRFTADSARWVLIGLQQGERQADSSLKYALDVIMYEGNQQRSVYEGSLQGSGEEELLHNFMVCGDDQQVIEHFFSVDFGYPACAYPQQHLLFSVDATGCHFITRYDSSSDSGYGNGVEFKNVCGPSATRDIQSVAFSSEPDEKQENLIRYAYSDSMHYHFDGTAWTSKAVTVKGKIFRQSAEQW